jgi:D-alanyl-D-alanine carboxypeptidase
MKHLSIYSILLISIFGIHSCEKDQVYEAGKYYNTLSFADSSASHPKAAAYQAVIDNFVAHGGVGTSVMIHDQHGTWLGIGGYADIASNLPIQTGNQFLIASISKVFTATAVFAYVDDGILSLDDSITKWLDPSLINEIDNASDCTIRLLLSHRSGIRDIYNFDQLMQYMNRRENNWVDKDMLEYVEGKKAYFDVDESWYYSNVNFTLLGMILEEASGLTLKEVYEQKIFNPLQLQSAYYDVGTNAIPPGLVKGYTDVNSNNQFVEAEELYEDDIGVGGDGGIAINAQDLGRFINGLMKGELISQNSLNEMTNWFDGGYISDGKAGYGLYYSEEENYGASVGHGGGIIGWESSVDYYPDSDITIVWMLNTDLILTTFEYDTNFNHFYTELKKTIFE